MTGTVGAGVIGRGVAHSFAQAGYEVLLLDVNEQKLMVDANLHGRKSGQDFYIY